VPVAPDSRHHKLRLAGLGVVSVAALAGLLWLSYTAFMGRRDVDLPVIMAPGEDYKVVPKDPGGLEVAHQDIRIYEALGRGRSGAAPEAIGLLPEAPRPVVLPLERAPPPGPAEDVAKAVPVPLPAPPDGGSPVPASPSQKATVGLSVQLGAFGTEAAAREAWGALREQHGDLLGRMKGEFVSGEGVVRVRAGPISTVSLAQLVCEQLKARDVDCFVVR